MFRRLIYFIIVSFLAIFAASLFSYSQTCWLIWSAVGLSLVTAGNTFLQRSISIASTGVLLAASTLLFTWLSSFPLLLFIFLPIATISIIYLMTKKENWLLSLYLLNFFILLAVLSDNNLTLNVKHAQLILLGTLIALLPQIIFWPHFISNQVKQTMLVSIQELQELINVVFFALLENDYPEKQYVYEKRIHTQKTKLIAARQQLQNLVKKNKHYSETKKNILTNLLNQFDLLYESFITCAQVRWQVTDHTIFGVCEQDLAGIVQEINRAFAEFIKILGVKNKLHADLTILTIKINQLEYTYQNVMQVTAREPIIILLFIANLQAFAKEIIDFNGQLIETRMQFK